jgi:hypothetical protein
MVIMVLRGDGCPMPMIEDMLFETEWPRTVDIELAVSADTIESGRGINSILSENPTRGLEIGRVPYSSDVGLVKGDSVLNSSPDVGCSGTNLEGEGYDGKTDSAGVCDREAWGPMLTSLG